MMPDEERTIVRLWGLGMPIGEIADVVGYTKNYVSQWASRHREECPSRATGRALTERERDIVRLWNEGVSVKRIAYVMGRKPGTIYKWASLHRDLCPKRRELPSQEKLARMWELRDSGKTWREVASEMGVNMTTIARWRRM